MKIEMRIRKRSGVNSAEDYRLTFASEAEFIAREAELANTKPTTFDESVKIFCREIARGCNYQRRSEGVAEMKTKKVVYIH